MGGGTKQLLSTAIFVGASFLLPGSAAFTTSLFVKRFAVSYGLSLITKALAPKFKTPNELFAQQEQQDTTSTSTVQSWKIPYGKTVTGGQLVYSATSVYDNNWAHLLIVFSPIAVEGYTEIYFNADKVASNGDDPANFLKTDGYRQSSKWHTETGGSVHATTSDPISISDGGSCMFYGWGTHGYCNGFAVGGSPTFSASGSSSSQDPSFWVGRGVRGIYNNTSGSAVNFVVATGRNTQPGNAGSWGWSYITLRNNYQLTSDYKSLAFVALYDGSSSKGSTAFDNGYGSTGIYSVNGNEENAYHHMFSDPVSARELLGRDTATDARGKANWNLFESAYVLEWANGGEGQAFTNYEPNPISSEFTKGYSTRSGNYVDFEHQRALFKPLAFAHITVKKDDVWQGGLPNVSVVVKGAKVYDPRESSHLSTNATTWEWSDNPALCLLNYLTNSEYGCSVSYDEIDIDSFISLANVCDEEITYSNKSSVRHNQHTVAFSTGRVSPTDTSGVFEWRKQDIDEIYFPFAVGDRIFFEAESTGDLNSQFLYSQPIYVSEFLPSNSGFKTSDTGITLSGNVPVDNISIRFSRKRYTCNGLVDTDNSMKTNIDNFLSSMAAKLIYVSGKYILIGGEYSAQEGLIDIDDIIGEISVTKHTPRRDRFNVVKTTFMSAAEDYKPRDAVISKNDITINRDGEENVVEIQLPMVTQPNQAKHLADITRLRGAYSMVVSMKCNMKVLQYRTGDVVRFTYERWGFTDRLFEISDMKINFGNPQSVDVTLVETGTNIYDHGSGA